MFICEILEPFILLRNIEISLLTFIFLAGLLGISFYTGLIFRITSYVQRIFVLMSSLLGIYAGIIFATSFLSYKIFC